MLGFLLRVAKKTGDPQLRLEKYFSSLVTVDNAFFVVCHSSYCAVYRRRQSCRACGHYVGGCDEVLQVKLSCVDRLYRRTDVSVSG